LIAAALSIISTRAFAENRYRVVLLQPETRTQFSAEVLTRVRGELEATSFELNVISAPPGLLPKEAVETAGAELDPEAVLLVDSHVDRVQRIRRTDVWLSDRVAQKTFVERLQVSLDDPERGATWVAVQAVELVRARLADSSIRPRAAHRPKPVEKPSTAEPREMPQPEQGPSFAAGLGLGLLHGFRGVGSSLAPVIRASVRIPTSAEIPISFHGRLSAASFGTANVVQINALTADVKQSFGTLDAVVKLWPQAIFQPMFTFGGGVYTVDVDGEANAPYVNHAERTWSGLANAGLGLWIEPATGIACVLEAQLLTAWSKTIVRLGDQEAAELGVPMGFFSAGLLGVF
jgi:hypothetical protein